VSETVAVVGGTVQSISIRDGGREGKSSLLYITVDFETAASQNIFSTSKLSLHIIQKNYKNY
jgi:hypothetical protein